MFDFIFWQNKIEKRGRKLLDYDGCRHNLETVQSASKRRDDIKVAKAKEQMEEARRLYEVLNKELHEELPALYNSRIPFLVQIFETLFNSEANFHREYEKVYEQFCTQVELLRAEAEKGSFVTDLSSSPYAKDREMLCAGDAIDELEEHRPEHDSSPSYVMVNNNSPTFGGQSPASQKDKFVFNNGAQQLDNNGQHSDGNALTTNDSEATNGSNDSTVLKKKDELFEIPIGATTKDLPPGVLYKVSNKNQKNKNYLLTFFLPKFNLKPLSSISFIFPSLKPLSFSLSSSSSARFLQSKQSHLLLFVLF